MTLVPLKELASLIRSKNAGPFEVTFDIIFDSEEVYRKVKASNVITSKLVSELYDVPTQNILTFIYFDLVNAIKFTLPRPRAQGGVGETDMHAAQQHAPLLDILIPMPD
jgi:hypothetical protein